MKPQITAHSFAGVHNKDLRASGSRIIQGATWRKQRVVLVIPADYPRIDEKDGVMHHYHGIPTKVYFSHLALMFPPNQGSYRMAAQGMEVGEAYSTAIAQIVGNADLSKWEYILTVEHDNAPPPDGLLKLIARMEAHPEFACIGGLYWTKGEGGVPQIWGDPKDSTINFRPQPPDPNGGLVECCGTGMGFNLWRMKMFQDARLRRPWFRTLSGIEGKGQGTQDLYFWDNARQFGYRCAVDCSVLVGHYDDANDVMY